MTLSIIVPTYNSQRSITELVRRIKLVKITSIQTEIIIVDDASKDNTAKLLKDIPGITYIRHKKNTGACEKRFQYARHYSSY